jgi:hypothetical protein
LAVSRVASDRHIFNFAFSDSRNGRTERRRRRHQHSAAHHQQQSRGKVESDAEAAPQAPQDTETSRFAQLPSGQRQRLGREVRGHVRGDCADRRRYLRSSVQSQRRRCRRAGGPEEGETRERERGLPHHRRQRDKDPETAQPQEHRQLEGDSDGQARRRRFSKGQGIFLSGVRVHGPRPDGTVGVRNGGFQRGEQRVHHETAPGRVELLSQEEFLAQGHQVQQHLDEQQVSRERVAS